MILIKTEYTSVFCFKESDDYGTSQSWFENFFFDNGTYDENLKKKYKLCTELVQTKILHTSDLVCVFGRTSESF